jgi:alpha-ketoglutarate-dependent taurine dioxygenase
VAAEVREVRAETSAELAESVAEETVVVFRKQAHQELTVALSRAPAAVVAVALVVLAGLLFAIENLK